MPDTLVKVADVEGNISLSGPQTIDSIPVVAGDKVLAPAQTTQAQNGIYAVAAGAWVKDSDLPVGTIFRQAQGRPRYTKGFWRYMGSQQYLNPPRRSPGATKKRS
jgi:hypothetical protein